MMKLYSLIALTVLTVTGMWAQALTNAGTITIQSNGTTDGVLYVDGDILITNTGAMQNDGVVEVKGDWTNNRNDGAITYSGTGSGLVKFTGAGTDQVISSTNSAEVVFNKIEIQIPLVVIANNFVEGVIANDNIRLNGGLEFNGGGIGMGTRDLIIGVNGTVTGYSVTHNAQFTSGTFVKKINGGSQNTNHAFPYFKVDGTTTYGSNYLPVDLHLVNAPAAADEIRVKFIPATTLGNIFHVGNCSPLAPGGVGNQNIMLNRMIDQFGYWEIDAEDAANNNLDNASGWYYDITLYPTTAAVNHMASSYGSDYFKILRTPSHSGNTQIPFNPSMDWSSTVAESGTYCNGIVETAGYTQSTGITATAVTKFSRFGGAGNDGGASLPVELLSLEATPVDNEFISVTWTTAVEVENAGFEVQRSTNGIDFETIGWVDGNGSTSVESDYGFNDTEVKPGVLYYYQLNQIDFNGDSELSHKVTAALTTENTFSISEFIPNPSNSNTRLDIVTSSDASINVTIFNTLGQIVTDGKHQITPGMNRVAFDVSSLADGTYHTIITVGNEVYNRKLVIAK